MVDLIPPTGAILGRVKLSLYMPLTFYGHLHKMQDHYAGTLLVPEQRRGTAERRSTSPVHLRGTEAAHAAFVVCAQSIEQDHRAVKRVTRSILGFKAFEAAQSTLTGIELMHMIKKKQMALEARGEGLTAASDVPGVSGRARREALLAGQADPATMAALAKRQMRSKLPALEQALTGTVRDHHRRLLTVQLGHIDFLDAQIEALNSAIESCMTALSQEVVVCTTSTWPVLADASLTARPAPARREDVFPPSSTAPDVPSAADLPPLLTCIRAVELLDTISGVNQRGAEMSVAEIGIDMARFGTAARLAAWPEVAPGNDESVGKQRSGKTQKGNQVVRAGLTQLAHGAARTKGTYLSALYRRLAVRRGKRRAILAVAHSIMVSVFPMLSRNAPYRELGGNCFDERRRHYTVDRLTSRIEHSGCRVHLEALPTAAA